MSEFSAYDRLLVELRETRGVLGGQLRPAAQQIVQVEIAHLVNSAREWRSRLLHSFAEIDHRLDDCRRHWLDIERAREELAAIDDQLSGLGQEPTFKPEEFMPSTDFVTAVISRLNDKR